jgi:hypothetical protein
VQELFATGRVVDLILLLVVIEAVAIGLYRRWRGGPPLGSLLVNLAAGAALLGALRLALGGAEWRWIAAMLGVALIAHAADLAARWSIAGEGR